MSTSEQLTAATDAMKIVSDSAKRSDTMLNQTIKVWPLILMIFMAGGGWVTFQSHSSHLDKLDSEMSMVKDRIGDMGGDLKAIRMILEERRASK